MTPLWRGVGAAVVGVALMTAGVAYAGATTPPNGAAGALDFGGATGGKGLPVNITADNGIEWRQAAHVYIARGNVKAVRGTLTVYADEMRAYYRPVKKPGTARPAPKPPTKPGLPGAQADEGPTEVYRLEAIGNVRFVTPTQTGYGDRADYDIDTTMLVMTGRHLKIVTPHDILTARDSIEWYDNRQLGVARGHAVDLHDGKTLAADVLLATIVHPPGQEAHASRIDGRGNVFVSSKDQIGRGDTGVYDVKSGVVTLTGHVRLTRGKDEMRGNYGVVDVNRDIGYLLPRAPGVNRGDNRVEALIVPDAKNGAPGTAPSKKKARP